jgi:acyl carrier protein
MNYLKQAEEILRDQLGTPDDTPITPETRLIEDLMCDSLDTVEILMAFEEEFDIMVMDEDAEKCRTVADILALLEKLRPSNITLQ